MTEVILKGRNDRKMVIFIKNGDNMRKYLCFEFLNEDNESINLFEIEITEELIRFLVSYLLLLEREEEIV